MSEARPPAVGLASAITGHARGSQPVLVVVATGGIILVLAGLVLAAIGQSAPGYVGTAIGLLCLLAAYRMRHTSQRDVDRTSGPHALPTEIVLSPSHIRIAGPGNLVSNDAILQTIARLHLRMVSQVPLPPAAGRVHQQDDGTLVGRPFGPGEPMQMRGN
jgi:hypothetical protein